MVSKLLHFFRMEYPVPSFKQESKEGGFTELVEYKENDENELFYDNNELAKFELEKEYEMLGEYEDIEDYDELTEYEDYFDDPGFTGMIKH
jgi:hypothetical protein